MAKTILKKELVLIDFEKNEFNFYYVEVLSVGYNEMQVISTYGKLGNKGRESIIRVSDFKEAMKIAYKKIYDKKNDGYVSKNKMKQANIAASSFFQKEETKKGSKKKPTVCNVCGVNIDPKMYKKINDWARGEGNWDKNQSFIGYKKVLCLNCQIENDIFKKRIGID